jgi:hypothetical protein
MNGCTCRNIAQAIGVLSALQEGLPEIARQILPSIDITKPFSRLNLS